VQGDLTLHNLGGMRGLSKTFAAVSLLGVVGAVACLVWRPGRARLGLSVWFGLPAVYAAMRVLDNDPITSRFAKLSEVLELVLYVALARVAVRAAVPRDSAPDTDDARALYGSGWDGDLEEMRASRIL
jgi:hypothetical protein